MLNHMEVRTIYFLIVGSIAILYILLSATIAINIGSIEVLFLLIAFPLIFYAANQRFILSNCTRRKV